MNDDLRDRLDDLERAAGDTDTGGLLVAFQRKPDGPLVDGDGDPLPVDVDPDVVFREREVMGRSPAEDTGRTILGPVDTPSSTETVYVDPDDDRGLDR